MKTGMKSKDRAHFLRYPRGLTYVTPRQGTIDYGLQMLDIYKIFSKKDLVTYCWYERKTMMCPSIGVVWQSSQSAQ